MPKLHRWTKPLVTVTACFALSTAISTPASADAGIPLIALVSPGFWLILPLVILLESFVALLILRKRIWIALKVAVISNIVSTVAGVPLRWLVVLALTPYANHQSAVCNTAAKYASGSTIGKFAFTIVDAPWGLGGTQEKWFSELTICWGILLIPFLLLSVLIEGLVADKLVSKEDKKRAHYWAWTANIISYILLFLMFSRMFGFVWNWLDY